MAGTFGSNICIGVSGKTSSCSIVPRMLSRAMAAVNSTMVNNGVIRNRSAIKKNQVFC